MDTEISITKNLALRAVGADRGHAVFEAYRLRDGAPLKIFSGEKALAKGVAWIAENDDKIFQAQEKLRKKLFPPAPKIRREDAGREQRVFPRVQRPEYITKRVIRGRRGRRGI